MMDAFGKEDADGIYVGTLALAHAAGQMKFQFLGGLKINRNVVIELTQATNSTDRFIRRVGRLRLTTHLAPIRPLVRDGSAPTPSALRSAGVCERIGPTRLGLALYFDASLRSGFTVLKLRHVAIGPLRFLPPGFDIVARAMCEPNRLLAEVAVLVAGRPLITYSAELS
jgi:hypothetical protein